MGPFIIVQGVNKVPFPSLKLEEITINNWALGHVYITNEGGFWCIRIFHYSPKNRGSPK